MNNDMIVNLKDFAILAAGWLTTYDINNLNTMAGRWLETTSSYPPIAVNISGDANNGFVEVGADGYSSDTQRIFLLADGQYAGEILWFRGGDPFRLDVSALGSGTHQLKAVGVDRYGNVTCSSPIETTFNCSLNYCLCPQFYEPNKPLYFYGFSSGGNISVKALEYGVETPLWSGVYSGGNLNGFIPAEVTALNNIDYVEFKDLSTEMSASKPAESTYEPNNLRALLILPNNKINTQNDAIIKAVRDAFESRNVPYKDLKGSGSSYMEIRKYANPDKYNINYIYYTGDGNYFYIDANGSKAYRTHVAIGDGLLYSFRPSDVRGGFDLYEMGFNNIKLAYFDCCWTGHLVYDGNNLKEDEEGYPTGTETLHNDMSKALKMNIGGSHFLQGWYGEKPTGLLNYKHLGPLVKNPYNYFSIYEWEKLRDAASLDAALDYAMTEVQKLPYDGDKAHDEVRLRGEGNTWEVKIE